MKLGDSFRNLGGNNLIWLFNVHTKAPFFVRPLFLQKMEKVIFKLRRINFLTVYIFI